MTPIAHISSGYIIYIAATQLIKIENTPLLIIAIIGSLIPDVDAFFGLNMKDHHNTIFHTPLFWLIIFNILFILGQSILLEYMDLIYIFFLGVFIHLLSDWITARTAGIRVFYPFKKNNYSLFKLESDKGNIPIFPNKNNFKVWMKFWTHYLKNKYLLAFEIIITITPIFMTII